MFENSEKRRKIRAYFFIKERPKSVWTVKVARKTTPAQRRMNPKLPEIVYWMPGRWSIILFVLGFFAVPTLFIEDYGIFIFLYVQIFLWLPAVICFFTALNAYNKQIKEYETELSKWGLVQNDLDHKPSGHEIDQWLQEDIQSIIPRGLDKLGLVREELVRDPMIITGPIFWKAGGIPDDEIVVIKDDRNILRFSCHRVVILCLSDTRVASFTTSFNFIRYAFLNENTVEYVYRDIVSVSTEEKSTNYDLPDGKTLRQAQFFRLAVASGDNIEVAISSPEIRDLFGGEPQLNNHEQTIRAIREMLREKKG